MTSIGACSIRSFRIDFFIHKIFCIRPFRHWFFMQASL